MQERGFLYVPVPGSEANAALLLKYLDRAAGKVRARWLVDRELHYPGIGPVFGCSAGHAALLCADPDKEVLAKEGMHEVGHLLGLEHCRNSCVMSLSDSKEKAVGKPAHLCANCIARLHRARHRQLSYFTITTLL